MRGLWIGWAGERGGEEGLFGLACEEVMVLSAE